MSIPIHLLILEDQPSDVQLIIRALRQSGYSPVWQCVATEAAYCAHLDTHHYDVILADYMLPQFTGIQALRVMQARGLDIPFIVITGAVNEEIAVECMKQGAADYFLKDRLTRLGPAVRQALHEKHMRDAKQQAETALRDSEARFRAIAAATPIPMVILQATDSAILYANAQFGVTFRLPAAQAIGRQIVDFWENATTYHTCVEVLSNDAPLHHEICLRRSDGSSFWAVVSVQRLLFDGQPALICGFYDITLRKQTEAALARHAQALAHSHSEIEQFLYIASHDLQEPLRKITSFVQLLAQRYEEKLDAEARTFIAYAVDGAQRMRQMLQGLLAYSRLTTRGTECAPTDCQQVLYKALSRLHTTLRECSGEITHDALPVVQAEAGQLEQVFHHLLDNALKFRRHLPPQVHVGVQRTDNAWVFSVRDNGIGIDPQYVERIFVIFKRLHGRTEYPGVGIGLALCKKIIERHRGRLWVESQLGQGATFFFTLPGVTDGPPEIPNEPAWSLYHGGADSLTPPEAVHT